MVKLVCAGCLKPVSCGRTMEEAIDRANSAKYGARMDAYGEWFCFDCQEEGKGGWADEEDEDAPE